MKTFLMKLGLPTLAAALLLGAWGCAKSDDANKGKADQPKGTPAAGAGETAKTPGSESETTTEAPKPTDGKAARKYSDSEMAYGFGARMAKELSGQGLEVNAGAVVKGFKDVMTGVKLSMSEVEMAATQEAVKTELQKRQAAGTPKPAANKATTLGKPAVVKSLMDKANYMLGVQLCKQMKLQDFKLDIDSLGRGIDDVTTGAKLKLTEEEITASLAALEESAKANAAAMGEKNKKAGETYLAANAKKPGVVVLPSGLQYKIVKKGTGKIPSETDSVSCDYRGKLIDGTEFDSSYKRGEPATFAVTGVIAGWTEALKLMPVGSKWKLFIPGNLAYGEAGRPGIPPNAVLVFDLELKAIK